MLCCLLISVRRAPAEAVTIATVRHMQQVFRRVSECDMHAPGVASLAKSTTFKASQKPLKGLVYYVLLLRQSLHGAFKR